MIASFLLAIEMPLYFRVDIFFAKQFDQPIDFALRFYCVLRVSGMDGSRNWPIKAAGQTDQTFSVCGQLVRCDHCFTRLCVFWHTQFHEGDESTEILITGAVTDKDGNGAGASCARLLNAYLGPDMRFDAIPFCSEMKSRCAINSIAVQQSHRRHLQLETGSNQLLRHRSALQKTKSRPRMQFNVHSHKTIHRLRR